MIIRCTLQTSSRRLTLVLALLLTSACQTTTQHSLKPSSSNASASAETEFSTGTNTLDSGAVAATEVQADLHMDSEIKLDLVSEQHMTLSELNQEPVQDAELLIPPSLEQDLAAAAQSVHSEPDEPQVLSFWQRYEAGLQMVETNNARIEAEKKWYLNHPAYLERLLDRATPVLPYILQQLEARNMPTELAMLPAVESAFQVFAYSPGRASGLWQIIPSTGRHLGLKQNWWYDGRRDIVAATDAALDYLEILAKRFDGDWDLALAAYNAGPGRISSAIRYNRKHGKPLDYWHLTRIRNETRNYVPKLHALTQIFTNSEVFRIELPDVSNQFDYEQVNIGQQLDLALAAELAELDVDTIYELNPAFNRWATDPDGPHHLLLPKSIVESFQQKLVELPESERVRWLRHKVQSGQTLSHIAKQHHTTVKIIQQANNLRGTQIRAGKYLLVPTSSRQLGSYTLSKKQRTLKTQSVARGSKRIEHRVESGDSLWLIGKQFGVSSNQLARWNGIAPGDTLSIGQKLVIWTSAEAETNIKQASLRSTPHPKQTIHYTVRKGDSLYLIAKRFNVSVRQIKQWNSTGKYLQPGQKLKLYIDVSSQSS